MILPTPDCSCPLLWWRAFMFGTIGAFIFMFIKFFVIDKLMKKEPMKLWPFIKFFFCPQHLIYYAVGGFFSYIFYPHAETQALFIGACWESIVIMLIKIKNE